MVVTFFGYRDAPQNIKPILEDVIKNLITTGCSAKTKMLAEKQKKIVINLYDLLQKKRYLIPQIPIYFFGKKCYNEHRKYYGGEGYETCFSNYQADFAKCFDADLYFVRRNRYYFSTLQFISSFVHRTRGVFLGQGRAFDGNAANHPLLFNSHQSLLQSGDRYSLCLGL